MNKKRTLFILGFAVFTVSATLGYLWGSWLMRPADTRPASVTGTAVNFYNPTVGAGTLLTREMEHLCGDLEKVSEGPAPDEILGMDREALAVKYPPAEGYTVSFTNEKYLTLTSKTNELCHVHKAYRHFGIYQGNLAVYEGPLEYNEKLLKVENVPVEALEPEFKLRLEQSMDLTKQARPTVDRLREEMEFTSEEALNAALDSIDEYLLNFIDTLTQSKKGLGIFT